jgi:hypothetical protein
MSGQYVSCRSTCRNGNEIGGFLEMIERGCLRLMKAGGGGLQRDECGHPAITPLQKGRVLNLFHAGQTVQQIAETTGWSCATVYKLTRKDRGDKKRGPRGPYTYGR